MISHLAETSVLTRLKRPEIERALERFARLGGLGRCTLTDLEIGFSASNAAEWDRSDALVSGFEPVDVTPVVISRARSVQRMLAAQGLKGRKMPDLVIAAAAELAGLTILHYDEDFEIIASVTGQRQEWIVPRGTVP